MEMDPKEILTHPPIIEASAIGITATMPYLDVNPPSTTITWAEIEVLRAKVMEDK